MRIGQIKLEYTRNPNHFILPKHVEVNNQVIIKTSYGLEIGRVRKISEGVKDQDGIYDINHKINVHESYFYLKKNMQAYGTTFKSEYRAEKDIDINYISQKGKFKNIDEDIEWYTLKRS